MKKLLACLLVATMSGCPDVNVDPDETQQGPIVEFDPARSQATGARFIPFPNDLARDPATGKVNLGPQACESATSKATRENVLNTLDGFGTFETAMQVSFTAAVDPASLDGNIVMYQMTEQGTPVSPSEATPIPVKVVRVGQTPRFASGNCNAPEMANAVTFVPMVPLDQKSTYFVALLKGIRSVDGKDFGSSYTWALVASNETPVTLDADGNVVSDRTPLDPADEGQRAQLQALAQMWKLHSVGIGFYEQTADARPRGDILVGFQFTTQTVTDPLDPMVEGSPASKLASVGILQAQSVTDKFGPYSALCGAEATTAPAQCFLKLALGGCSPLTTGCGVNNYTDGNTACQLLGCADIGDVIGGGIATANYQKQLPNPLTGGKPIQGAWSDPLEPKQQDSLILETLIVVPTGNAPNKGWPTIVFGHPLSSSKESALAIAGRFAGQGFATVAIDTSAHGSRAVRTSKDINLGCMGRCMSGMTPTATECDTIAQCNAGEFCGAVTAEGMPLFVPPSPTTASQCYAPFLSPDLAATRDAVRQTVLDHLRVVKAIKTCGASGCAGLSFDPTKIYWASASLGSVIGGMSAGLAPDIKTAVLDAGGMGWADFLENTETLAVRCSLVNGLIDAGILTGEKWTGGSTGLCTTDEWKAQPGYATFAAIGRWVLDPADPANFASRLATKRLLIQEIVGDTVMPNVVTQTQAALVGLAATPLANDPFNPLAPAPSAAITTSPMTNKYVRYTSDANSVFAHPSMLRPATKDQAGANGTLRLQVDAATYLKLNP